MTKTIVLAITSVWVKILRKQKGQMIVMLMLRNKIINPLIARLRKKHITSLCVNQETASERERLNASVLLSILQMRCQNWSIVLCPEW